MWHFFQSAIGRWRLGCAVLVFLGLVAAGDAWAEHRYLQAVERFEESLATVEHCTFHRSREVRNGVEIWLYTPQVEYRYSVTDEKFTGTQYSRRPVALEGTLSRDLFEQRHGPGERVACFFDPDNPSDAVLTRESDRSLLHFKRTTAIVLLALGVLGWGLLEYFLRVPTQPRPQRTDRLRGLPDDVPPNDALARTRALIDDYNRGYDR
jgi:hypothetical protein